jgi:hypothetical protein
MGMFLFKIVGSHAVLRNNTVRSLYPLVIFSLKVTSCQTMMQYHNHNIDVDIVKIQSTSVTTKIPCIDLV